MNEKHYGKIQWNIDDKDNYLEFYNKQETDKWGKEIYLKWADKYKDAMSLAEYAVKTRLCTNVIESYCGYEYRQINNFFTNCNNKLDTLH